MREQRTTDVRFTDIARQMGMTPPALYRYFADRDELLTALIVDGYGSLGARDRDALRAAARRRPGRPLDGRRRRVPRLGPQRAAAVRARSSACRCRATRSRRGADDRGGEGGDGAAVQPVRRGRHQRQARRAADPRGLGGDRPPASTPSTTSCRASLPPESFQAMLQTWAMLHGFVSLEAYGHFDWIEPEARDALFHSHIRLAATAAGLPVPPA